MLSVNRFFKTLLVLSIFNLLCANEILDIKGIRLGDTYNESIKLKLSCKIKKNYEVGLYVGAYVTCGSKGKRGSEYALNLDHNNKIYQIERRIDFSIEPDFEKIKKQFFAKYGPPTKMTYMKAGYKNNKEGFCKDFCWGDNCNVRYRDNGFWKGEQISRQDFGKRLLISYEITTEYKGILFHLSDHELEKSQDLWFTKQFNELQKNKRDEESSLDL